MQTEVITLVRPVWCWSSNLSECVDFCHESISWISEKRCNRFVAMCLIRLSFRSEPATSSCSKLAAPCAAMLHGACSQKEHSCALHGQELLDLDLAMLDIAPLPQKMISASPAKVHAKIRLSPVSAANHRMQSGLICRVFQRSIAVPCAVGSKTARRGSIVTFSARSHNQKVLKGLTRGRSYWVNLLKAKLLFSARHMKRAKTQRCLGRLDCT